MRKKANEIGPGPGEIYSARFKWRTCEDCRPCIVTTRPKDGWVEVVPLSAAMPLFDASQHFPIRKTDGNFVATGLRRDSYAGGAQIRKIPVSDLGAHYGQVSGTLAKDFWEWLGLTPDE